VTQQTTLWTPQCCRVPMSFAAMADATRHARCCEACASSSVMASYNTMNAMLQHVTLQIGRSIAMACRSQKKICFPSSSRLHVVSLALAFTLEVAKTIDMEELTVEKWNLICLCILVPQALVSTSSRSKLRPTMVGN
jgi:hypothetical protein